MDKQLCSTYNIYSTKHEERERECTHSHTTWGFFICRANLISLYVRLLVACCAGDEYHFKHFLMSSVVTYAICREVFNKINWWAAQNQASFSSHDEKGTTKHDRMTEWLRWSDCKRKQEEKLRHAAGMRQSIFFFISKRCLAILILTSCDPHDEHIAWQIYIWTGFRWVCNICDESNGVYNEIQNNIFKMGMMVRVRVRKQWTYTHTRIHMHACECISHSTKAIRPLLQLEIAIYLIAFGSLCNSSSVRLIEHSDEVEMR